MRTKTLIKKAAREFGIPVTDGNNANAYLQRAIAFDESGSRGRVTAYRFTPRGSGMRRSRSYHKTNPTDSDFRQIAWALAGPLSQGRMNKAKARRHVVQILRFMAITWAGETPASVPGNYLLTTDSQVIADYLEGGGREFEADLIRITL